MTHRDHWTMTATNLFGILLCAAAFGLLYYCATHEDVLFEGIYQLMGGRPR